jgi:CRP-like cAMP-binding protein
VPNTLKLFDDYPGLLLTLPEPIRNLALRDDVLRHYEAGDPIQVPGCRDDLIRYIVGGEARMVLKDPVGAEVKIDILSSGNIFGEVSHFTGSPWPSDAQLYAETDCLVISFSSEDFEGLIKESPVFASSLISGLVRKLMGLQRRILEADIKRKALESVISRVEHVFPNYIMGDYVRSYIAERVDDLSSSDGPVLIIGETGVGKEGFAHSIFTKSNFGKGIFLQLDMYNSSGIANGDGQSPEDLWGNEWLTEAQRRMFFGSEEPGPNGSTSVKPGYFELTDGGTLFVRGIEKLTREMQFKLMEALIKQTFVRYGGTVPQKAQVRLIATTRISPAGINPSEHPLLNALMSRSIIVPPLRKRRREIPLLARRYLEQFGKELRRSIQEIPKDALKCLVNYSWPGNDMELASTLKRALMISERGCLTPNDIYFGLKRTEGNIKFNLLKIPIIRRLLLSRRYPSLIQAILLPSTAFVVLMLLFGPPLTNSNPAALFSWCLGWPLLVLVSFLSARSWCAICPIGFFATKARGWYCAEKALPPAIKAYSPFILSAAVVAVISMESVFHFRQHPVYLGLFLISMAATAVVIAMIFSDVSWCEHFCALGGLIGVLAKASILEVRADRNVCISQCVRNDCYLGTENSPGCSFGQAGPKLVSNRLCKVCAQCIKNCPHGAISLNLRFPGTEILEYRPYRPAFVFLTLSILGSVIAEMICSSPAISSIEEFLSSTRGPAVISVFVGVITLIIGAFTAASRVSDYIYKDSYLTNWSRFGLAFIPLTLTTMAAFHLFFMVDLFPLLDDSIKGLFDTTIVPAVNGQGAGSAARKIQLFLIAVGFIWTSVTIYRLGKNGHERKIRAIAGMLMHWGIAAIITYVVVTFSALYFLPA